MNSPTLPLRNELAVVHQGEIVPSLDELASTVEREHRAVVDAVQSALLHALEAGLALLNARATLADDVSFERWVDERGVHHRTAQKYMRLATYRDELMALPEANDLSMTRAHLFLRGLPRRIGPDWEAREAMIAEIRRLKTRGDSQKAIARTLGISVHTVRYHTNVKYREKRKRDRMRQLNDFRKARKYMETERRLRDRGGSVSEGYALVRRALLQLQAALEEATTVDERRELERAMASLHETEDWIGRAIRADVPAARRTKVRRAKVAA